MRSKGFTPNKRNTMIDNMMILDKIHHQKKKESPMEVSPIDWTFLGDYDDNSYEMKN